jgi:hypothetical protein
MMHIPAWRREAAHYLCRPVAEIQGIVLAWLGEKLIFSVHLATV